MKKPISLKTATFYRVSTHGWECRQYQPDGPNTVAVQDVVASNGYKVREWRGCDWFARNIVMHEYGWEEGFRASDLACLVFKFEGTLYISREVLDAMGVGQVWEEAPISIGRRRFFTLEQVFDSAVYSASYERRSDRERAVQARSQQILDWLMELNG